MKNIGIFYGSTTGNTEDAAKQILEEFGAGIAETFDVSESTTKDVEQFSNLIFGASTWGIGDIQDDFEEFLEEIARVDLQGKKIAIYGFGDQDAYPDSFVDAIGTIYALVKNKGAELVGQVSVESYDYDESTAEIDGQFAGLPLDEENQSDLTGGRIKSWVELLKTQFA